MGTFIFWTIVVLLIVGGVQHLMEKAKMAVPNDAFHWPPTEYCEVEVVGESNYQDAIKSVVGEHGERSPTGTFKAALIPEDDNEYDNKAVMVAINGKTVGYLSRDDARSFRRRLAAKKLHGQTTTCDAMITGGYIPKGGKRTTYGVQLAIKEFA